MEFEQQRIQKQRRRRPAHVEEGIEPPLPREEREQVGETTVRIVQKIDRELNDGTD